MAARSHLGFFRPAILRRIGFEVGGIGGLRSSEICPRAASEGAVVARPYLFPARGERTTHSCQQEKSKPTQFHGRVAGSQSATDPAGRGDFLYLREIFGSFSPSWLKTLSGRLQEFEVEDVLKRVRFGRRRKLYFESLDHHRRMLQNSSRRNQKSGDRASALESGVKYNVIKIDDGGNLSHLELKSSQLGLHPRDIDLLSSSTFIPQRATISVQRDKVLVRMENVRAIVFKDHVLLFDARHPRMSMEKIFSSSPKLAKEGAQHRARDCFAKALAQKTRELPFDLVDPMPFHLCVVESLLEETSNFFHQKVNRLRLLVERILHELTRDVSMGGLQKLLPLRRAVTEVEHDVRDAHEAMDQVLGSDDTLQALCLVNEDGKSDSSPDPNRAHDKGSQSPADREEHIYKLRQATADMLFTYQREVDDAGGVLEELRKGMEAAQEVWELGLNTTRNRIIRMNLYFSVTTCFLALSTLPAAFFGMNLVSGYEEQPEVFYWVLGGAVAIPSVMLTGVVLAFHMWPKVVDRRRAQDLAGLLDLLRHLDSVDDIVEAVAREVSGRTISEREFKEILKKYPAAQLMRQKELDIIFRMFDRNRNGVIGAKEQEAMNSSFSGYNTSSPSPPKREV